MDAVCSSNISCHHLERVWMPFVHIILAAITWRGFGFGCHLFTILAAITWRGFESHLFTILAAITWRGFGCYLFTKLAAITWRGFGCHLFTILAAITWRGVGCPSLLLILSLLNSYYVSWRRWYCLLYGVTSSGTR